MLTSLGAENLPAGEFVIKPYWGGYEKDRIVSAMLNTDVQPSLVAPAALGIMLMIASVVVAVGSARRTPKT